MPLTGTGNTLGTAIWNAIKALSWVTPDYLNGVEDGRLEELWQTVATEIVNHVIANSDIPVQPGTFVVEHNGTRPVTGQGDGSIV